MKEIIKYIKPQVEEEYIEIYEHFNKRNDTWERKTKRA